MRRVLFPLLVLFVSCHRGAVAPAALPPRDAYAGSAACRECHDKKYEHWTHDWHARALSPATAAYVEGKFDDAHFRGLSSEAWMERRGEHAVMRTRDDHGQLGAYDVSWVIGGKRMQDAVTVMDDGRWQVLPVYYHVTGGGAWVDYNESKQGAVTPDHPFFWTNFRRTANKECLDCHATGVDVRYDATSKQWSTKFVDAGVACESCHGPGALHSVTRLPRDIVHPGEATPEVELAICGQCHGPREPLFPALMTKERFRPGQRYDDRFEALVLVDGRERSGEYFVDGRPSSSSFEYQALLQSRCHLAGGTTCLTCHTAPHDRHGANEIDGDPDASCRKCHKDIAASGVAHTHHQKTTCVACHMPPVVSGVLDKFADHTIDVPNAANTIRHDVPNACGVCHADRSNATIAADLARLWPDSSRRQQRRTRIADAVDEKTTTAATLTAVVRDTSEAPTLRGAMALLLAQRFPRETESVLVPLLHDRDALVRARFLEALGTVGARKSVDVLATFLHDPAIAVRQNAALALASMHDARGQSALAKMAADPATRDLFRPHVMLSIAAANRGDFDTATREIDTALTLAPYVSDALVFRADLEARRGDMSSARNDLHEALRFNPRHRGALGRLQVMQ